MPDVSNHLKTLNPDVPDFQPGKAWKNDTPAANVAHSVSPPEKEQTNAPESDWNRGLGQRKKPTKKKVSLTNLEASNHCRVIRRRKKCLTPSLSVKNPTIVKSWISNSTKNYPPSKFNQRRIDLERHRYHSISPKRSKPSLLPSPRSFVSPSSARENDQFDFELDDDDIDKILIITPTPPSHRKQQQAAGEYTPRARMTAELAKIIDDGLKWYEKELWQDRPGPVCTLTNASLPKNNHFHVARTTDSRGKSIGCER